MKRIFIAIKVVPGEILLRMISSLKTGLGTDSIKWTNPDNIHITLAFPGDTSEEQVVVISKMLKDKCEGSGKFELTISGSGVFKSFVDPRIIWTGIEPSQKLTSLYEVIKSGLAASGIRLEERQFNPHMTLGRIKRLNKENNLKEILERFSDIEIQKVAVNEIILFESILLQTGPVYKPIVAVLI